MAAASAGVKSPTLLVRGKRSDMVSDEGVAEFRALVPHAEYVDVAGASHMVTGDHNDAFSRAIVAFLERTCWISN
jgi:pimeloyl-ACP methyl ester carboxylesterase